MEYKGDEDRLSHLVRDMAGRNCEHLWKLRNVARVNNCYENRDGVAMASNVSSVGKKIYAGNKSSPTSMLLKSANSVN